MRLRLLALILCVTSCEAKVDPPDSGTGGGGSSTGGGSATGGGGGATGGGAAGGGGSASGGGGATGGGSAGGGGAATLPLAEQYPGDVGIAADSRVLFHSDFENGMAGWTRYTTDTQRLTVENDSATAHTGTRYMKSRITRSQLAVDQYLTSMAQVDLSTRVPELYWRFYARIVGTTATPHHWVRVAAGTPAYQSDGLANTKPAGNAGFWFDTDLNDDDNFNFYVYWHAMRSGRCNDGSTTPGCAGDQGTTYFYGNNFNYANQQAIPRDAWFCVEIHAKANTIGDSDGELTLWKNDALVADYRPGNPRGRWLRDNFFSWGQYFLDLGPFDGFDFRTDADVLLKRVTLDAYYERGTLPASAPEEQVILYDDVVVATSRIGCRR